MIRSVINAGARVAFLWMIGLATCLSGGIAWAQVTTGTISGTVKDNSGAVIPEAQVVILNEGTGISRTVQTDKEGHYLALSLSLGNYRVTGSHEGFEAEVRTGIELTVGREAVVDLALAVGSTTQTVQVTGEAPLVESTTGSLGSLVDDKSIRALPLNGRSYDQLALLQPGVVLESPGLVAVPPFAYGSSSRFSVGGQRETSNLFLLDGTNINDQGNGTPGGAAGTNLGVDTILEFKIFTNSWDAEYGHSSGSITSAITRSGTNTLHGTAFEYIRNSVLDAKNYFDVGSSAHPFRRNQFGGVLGGPIKKDKTFFFAGYEGLRQAQETTLTATVPTALARQGILPTEPGSTTTQTVTVAPAVVPYLALWPLPNGRDYGNGTAQFVSAPPLITNEDNFMVRVDDQLTAKTQIFGRYTFDTDSQNGELVGIPNFVSLASSRRQYSTLQANTVFSDKALNNFRFAFNRSYEAFDELLDPAPAGLSFVPGQPMGLLQLGGGIGGSTSGATAITPVGFGGGNGPVIFPFNIFEWADDLSYIKGKHSLRMGVDIQRMMDDLVRTNSLRGSYTFSSLSNFLTDTSPGFSVQLPLGVRSEWAVRQSTYGAYGQDQWTVNSRLTLNLGLRWEATTAPYDADGKNAIFPSPLASDTVLSNNFFNVGKNNFAPRVGIAWRLDDSGKTVLRAGAGIYYNLITPVAYFNELAMPPFFGTYTQSNAPFPNAVASIPANARLYIIRVMAPFDKTPVEDEYNLSIQRQILRNTVVQIAYAGSKAYHLELQSKGNNYTAAICPASPCPAGLPAGTPYYPADGTRPNPNENGYSYFPFDGESIYNSGTVSLRQQSSSGLVGQIFYTYQRSTDDSSNTGGNESTRSSGMVMNPFCLRCDWGASDFNQTQRLGANFSYPVPFQADSKVLGAVVKDWTVNGIASYSTGMPFSALLMSSVSRDGATILADRPNLNPGFSNSPTHGVSAGCTGFAAGTRLGGASNYFDPCAFSLPLAGTYGNVGRNTIIGPGLVDVDLSVEKGFKLEKAEAKFRFEMFNVANHTNLGVPNNTPVLTTGAANPATGVITYTTTSSRQLQFALRISF